MEKIEAIIKIIVGFVMTIFGINFYLKYKKGQEAEKQVKINEVENEIKSVKTNNANTDIQSLIDKANKRAESDNKPK